MRSPTLTTGKCLPVVTFGISPDFSGLFLTSRQITHVLRTLSPLQPSNIATRKLAFDLHVLSTPPAFVLSQNQTLRMEVCWLAFIGSCQTLKLNFIEALLSHNSNFKEFAVFTPQSPVYGTTILRSGFYPGLETASLFSFRFRATHRRSAIRNTGDLRPGQGVSLRRFNRFYNMLQMRVKWFLKLTRN